MGTITIIQYSVFQASLTEGPNPFSLLGSAESPKSAGIAMCIKSVGSFLAENSPHFFAVDDGYCGDEAVVPPFGNADE